VSLLLLIEGELSIKSKRNTISPINEFIEHLVLFSGWRQFYIAGPFYFPMAMTSSKGHGS